MRRTDFEGYFRPGHNTHQGALFSISLKRKDGPLDNGWVRPQVFLHTCVYGRKEHCCHTMNTERVKPSWPRHGSHSLLLPVKIETQSRRHLCAVVWREVALLQSRINGIDLPMGYRIAGAEDQKNLASASGVPGNSGSTSGEGCPELLVSSPLL